MSFLKDCRFCVCAQWKIEFRVAFFLLEKSEITGSSLSDVSEKIPVEARGAPAIGQNKFGREKRTWRCRFVTRKLTSLRPLFTKFLTPGLTCKLDRALFTNFFNSRVNLRITNPLDERLESTSPASHPAGYIIHLLTRELKIW